jgi:membrane protease YdiL (CAAX protease family)
VKENVILPVVRVLYSSKVLIKYLALYFCHIFIVFFFPTSILLLEPMANTVLLYIQDSAVLLVVAFFLFWLVLWLPFAGILAIALRWQPNQPLAPAQKIPLIVSLYLLAPLILWGIQWLGLGSFASYGWVNQVSILQSLLLGFLAGVIGIVLVFSCQLQLGWCNLETEKISLIKSHIIPISLVALFVGGIEELIFRGFLLTTLDQDYPLWVAAVLSSIIFAVLHLIWEQKETVPQLPGLWLMGMVLVTARLVNGNHLGIAWGLHTGWVWAIATIDTVGLISYTGKVSEIWTGKYQKPLAGITGIICVVGTGIALWGLSSVIL